MIKKLRSNQKGDTIVEVLVAIVIVGMVLTGAYVSSAASLNLITADQQHTNALGIAQNQVEDLRAKSTLLPTYNFQTQGSTFCFNSQNLPVQYVQATPQACTANGYVSEIQSEGNNDGVGTYTFVITVNWTTLDNNPARVQIYYRVGV